MRRLVLLPVLVAATVGLSACSSSTGAGRTVTVKRTVTSQQQSAPSQPSNMVTVPASGGTTTSGPSGSQGSGGPSTAPSTGASSPSGSTGPTVKVDPLKADCSILLSQSDVKKALDIDIASGSYRIKDVADEKRGVTGKVRCRYGSTDNGKTGKVGVLLTQFKDTTSADTQISLSRQTEQDNGSTVTEVTVAGHPAVLMINKGGEIVLRYDTWTLSVSTRDGVAPAATLTEGLPKLAEQVLARILKNG